MEAIYCFCPLCPIFIVTKHPLGMEPRAGMVEFLYPGSSPVSGIYNMSCLHMIKKTLIINNLEVQSYKLAFQAH